MNGIINIIKPTGMTSHDVINYIRRNLNIKKAGHAGTLDPNAAGVLIICLGKATRLAEYLIESDKEYVAEIKLGVRTDTYDKYGNLTGKKEVLELSEKMVKEALKKMEGKYIQIPPRYSAIKYNGKKLYEYARQGIEKEIKGREVDIKEIMLIKYEHPYILFKSRVSKGTYIRSLCVDVAEKLGAFGTMSVLVRSMSKNATVNSAYSLEELKKLYREGNIESCFTDYSELIDFPVVNVSGEEKGRLINGIKINKKIDIEAGKVFISFEGLIFAVGEYDLKTKILKSKKMLV